MAVINTSPKNWLRAIKVVLELQLLVNSKAWPSPASVPAFMATPKKVAAAIAVREVRQWLAAHEWPQMVIFVAFDEESRRLYEQELADGGTI